MANGTTGTATAKRFQLPALDFKFTSLTDGTDIPPPPPSPKQEPAPKPAPKTGPKTAPVRPKTPTKETLAVPAAGQETQNGDANGHVNGTSVAGHSLSRPPSRSASTIADERKAKRGSGWFRRLRSSDSSNKRSSRQFEEPKKPAGPPPPMIPELSALETKVDIQMGDDLFKGIK